MILKKVFRINSEKIHELPHKNFQSEKILQIMIEKNLNKVFEDLEFLTTEFKINDLRPDTVAFDFEKNCFVIIEYKNIKNKQILDQGATYFRMLMEQSHSFVLLYNRNKGKQYDVSNFNWDESYVIFVSPEFTKYQIGASGIGIPVRLFRISYYDNEIITLERIEEQLNSKLGKIIDSTNKTRKYNLDEYDENKYLDGTYHTGNSSVETKKLYFTMKKSLLEKFEKLEVKIRKSYIGFYLKDNASCICTLEVGKSSINLCYSTTVKKGIISDSIFIRNVEKIGTAGVGQYQSKIKSEDDFTKALPFIEKVYNHKSAN